MAYSGRWIGHVGPIVWPPRLPDLTLLDYFPMWQSQGIGVLRRNDYTKELSCSSACCSYFSGHSAVAAYALVYSTKL
ncbi:uncharacterized protein TNCV_3738721 [Trichonephila clavipes]|nr:uncharacterized protein TNCV_3738721 [Trichonephila clavipes]